MTSMTWKQIGLWCLLADFVALTIYAIVTEGYFAFVPASIAFATSSAWGAQVIVDFLLALGVTLGFVIADARQRGLNAWPFVALTFVLGSIGPVAYLIHRERAAGALPEHRRAAAQPA
jgi:hypothetical protein